MAGALKETRLKARLAPMQPYLREVERQMVDYVGNGNGCRQLQDICVDFFSAGGKRLRPLLCIVSCLAVGGKMEPALKVAVASELMHSMSLIHDDIIDGDETRRGRPTVHVAHGVDKALLSGDYLLAKSFAALCDCATDVEPDAFERIVRGFSDTCTDACAGEMLDIDFDYSCSLDYYIRVCEYKTARFIVTNLQAGGLCGGATERQLGALGAYGRVLGISFQIVDDIIGLRGTKKRLGKTPGIDIVSRRPNVISVLALRHQPWLREELESDLTEADIPRFVDRFEELGCFAEAQDLARVLNEEAKASLRELPSSKHRRVLADLADYALFRES